MQAIRVFGWMLFLVTVFLAGSDVFGQIVINELVEDEQDFETTDVAPDTREFIELYNAGATAVDLTGWSVKTWDLDVGVYFTEDTIPSGSIPAGGYFVIGGSAVPNVNYSPVATDLWDNTNVVFEIRNPSNVLIDAVGVETFRGVELANATQEQLNQMNAGETAGTTAKSGWWGQLESNNDGPDGTYPNLPMSLGRYRDGRDNNVNGRDFGLIPATPGATNNLLTVAEHEVTNVDTVAVSSVLRDDYYASFKLPRVITPGTADAYNPSAIPASPQGGRAIIAWDETGGGNSVHSDEYTNKFAIYAYINPTAFNNTTATSTQSEATIYGIGTTDPLFSTPNSAGLLTGQPGTGGDLTSSPNGSTGLGWLIQRRTSNTAGTQSSAAVLQLIDFGDGGDGVMGDNEWTIVQSIDLTGVAAGWHVLGIDYDPATGSVTGTYDANEYNFNTVSGLVGNFYIGYRENLPGTGASGRPPTYDLFVDTTDQPGDFNDDGKVDAADYVAARKNGVPADITAFFQNFGEPAPGSGGGVGVPEPVSIGLFILAVAGLATTRRRPN